MGRHVELESRWRVMVHMAQSDVSSSSQEEGQGGPLGQAGRCSYAPLVAHFHIGRKA